MPERARHLFATAGIFLWLSLVVIGPWHALEARRATWLATCAEFEVGAGSDPCFSDYIPVLELSGIPILVLAAAYPIAVFAFSLVAPPAEDRQLRWRLAVGNDGSDGIPARPFIGLCFLALSIWLWSGLQVRPELIPLHIFWLAASLWLLAGIAIRIGDVRRLRLKRKNDERNRPA